MSSTELCGDGRRLRRVQDTGSEANGKQGNGNFCCKAWLVAAEAGGNQFVFPSGVLKQFQAAAGGPGGKNTGGVKVLPAQLVSV